MFPGEKFICVMNRIPEKKVGRLAVLYGPMKSGKSIEIVRCVHTYKPGWEGRIIMVVKKNSIRFSDEACFESRSGARLRSSDVDAVVETDSIAEVVEKHLDDEHPCIIAIDEAHFFSDLVENVRKLLDAGHFVMAAGLDLSWKGEPFHADGGVLGLLQFAPEINIHNLAVCAHCKGIDAIYTALADKASNDLVQVGADNYSALCRKCWVNRDLLGYKK